MTKDVITVRVSIFCAVCFKQSNGTHEIDNCSISFIVTLISCFISAERTIKGKWLSWVGHVAFDLKLCVSNSRNCLRRNCWVQLPFNQNLSDHALLTVASKAQVVPLISVSNIISDEGH